MKKIITIFLALTGLLVNAQMRGKLIQGTIQPGTSDNSIKVVLKSSATFSGQFSNVQFTFQIPDSIVPRPTVTLKNNLLSDYIPTKDYETRQTHEGGFYNYLFAAVTIGSPKYNFVAGAEVEALEVQIIYNGEKNVPVKLASLPNGGSTGQCNFYVEISGNDNTNVTSMFYGAAANNRGSYSKYSYVGLPADPSSKKNNVLVYPTLTQDQVNVILPTGYEKAIIRIVNESGNEVGANDSKTLSRTISLKKFPNGAYMMKVTNNNKITNSVKVILQK